MEVRQGIREHREVQGGQIHPGGGVALRGVLSAAVISNCRPRRGMVLAFWKHFFLSFLVLFSTD